MTPLMRSTTEKRNRTSPPSVPGAPCRSLHRRVRRLALILLLTIVVYSTCVEPFWIQVARYTLRRSDLPAAFDGLRIVLLTDVHRGSFISQQRVHTIVDQVNALQGDLIVLGGDYIQGGDRYIVPCFEELKRLKAPDGVVAVLGNHDNVGNRQLVRDQINASGMRDLDNTGFWLVRGPYRLRIAGVDECITGFPDLAAALGDANKDDYTILVAHNPAYVDSIPDNGMVDLVLSGHTHGGQVTLFGWVPHVPASFGGRCYLTGLVHRGTTDVIISNGTGMSIAPVRFCARPQIVVITLKTAAPAS